MGGLHLSGALNEKIIPETVRDMAAFRLERILPGHCTGWRAINALSQAFGETVTPIAAIPQVVELNIGHFLGGEAVFIGLAQAIRRMRLLMDEARSGQTA
jgi:hypothetical protein